MAMKTNTDATIIIVTTAVETQVTTIVIVRSEVFSKKKVQFKKN